MTRDEAVAAAQAYSKAVTDARKARDEAVAAAQKAYDKETWEAYEEYQEAARKARRNPVPDELKRGVRVKPYRRRQR